MKVLLPEGANLNNFERSLQKKLEKAKLDGYALMGFSFKKTKNFNLSEIDALIILKAGQIVCLEAKNYEGEWTGGANDSWFSNKQKINSSGANPYCQVRNNSFTIKDRLGEMISDDEEFWVEHAVVAPNLAAISIKHATVDKFDEDYEIAIIHIGKLEEALRKLPSNLRNSRLMKELRGIEQIVSKLIDISPEMITTTFGSDEYPSRQRSAKPKLEPASSCSPIEKLRERQYISAEGNSACYKPASFDLSPPEPTPIQRFRRPISIAASVLLAFGAIGAVGLRSLTTSSPEVTPVTCDAASEIELEGVCYKNLSASPLTIGVLTPPEFYEPLKKYLEKQFASQGIKVAIDGGDELTYQDAQNRVAEKSWDLFFAYSPVNSMRAKDNGYQWIGKMFPDSPSTYQSTLFVKADSPIRSLADITSSTTIALGDENSMSSFYMPVYDLYGKSLRATIQHRSSEIKELVANRKVDIGATAFDNVKEDQRFRIIHMSREIPSSGVYLSPRIAPAIQEQIKTFLTQAPAAVKKQANYGDGTEPDFELIRQASMRVDEIRSCADFSSNPVNFYCDREPQGIVGRVSGFTYEGQETIRLRLERETDGFCSVLVTPQVLSQVPNGTSPGLLNQKEIDIVGVEPQTAIDGTCELKIEAPEQLNVL